MMGPAAGVVYFGIRLVILIGCRALEPVQLAVVKGSKPQYEPGPDAELMQTYRCDH